jgi:uncharacterized protein (DUF58 family)
VKQAFDPAVMTRLEGLEWRARYVMEGFLGGLHESPFHGLSVEFLDYRDYQPGDDLRRVDWRLFARSDRLSVKRYEQETNARAYLLVDTSASMAYRGARAWASKLDAAKTLAFALARLLLRQNDAVGLLALEDSLPRYVRPSQKPHHAGLLMRELTALEPRGGAVLAELLERAARIVHRRSLLILLTDLLEPAERLESLWRRLRFQGHECVCLQVLDGDELDFPFDEAALFEDLETGVRRQVDGPRVRAAYQARFGAFMARHRERLVALDVSHATLRTDEDPGAALGRFLSGLGRRRR